MTATAVEGTARPAAGGAFWPEALRRYRRNRPAWVAAWVLLALVLVAVFAEAISPYSPYEQFLERSEGGAVDPLQPRTTGKFEAPSLAHPLGTDQLARDVFTRTLIGLRISLAAAAVAIAVATLLGTLAVLGPRASDALLMRATDAAFAIRALLLVILLRSAFGSTAFGHAALFGVSADLLLLFVAIAFAAWPEMARLVRGQLLSIRELDHVVAAESLGCSPARIAVRHMLPLTLPVMLVQAAFLVPSAIAAEAALSFIGIGAAPPTPSLGVLASDHFAFVAVRWTALASTTALLVAIFLAFQLIGDGLAAALAPRRGR